MLTLPVGLVFELPVAAHVLAQLGIVSSAMMKSYRKHAIVIIVITAAVITPPDVFSQVLISVPLILLYEVSIIIARRVEKKQMALEPADTAKTPNS
jgi:sec-independent protein translocase protein TatC